MMQFAGSFSHTVFSVYVYHIYAVNAPGIYIKHTHSPGGGQNSVFFNCCMESCCRLRCSIQRHSVKKYICTVPGTFFLHRESMGNRYHYMPIQWHRLKVYIKGICREILLMIPLPDIAKCHKEP